METLSYNEAAEMLAIANELEMELEKNHDNNLTEEQRGLLRRAKVVRRFLEQSPSQMTYEGLFQVHAALEEGELGVLFRNNHFATIVRRQGVLYGLVTDVGYMHTAGVVWETMESIGGDSEMVDGEFRGGGGAAEGWALMGGEEAGGGDGAMAAEMQKASDAEMARRLQAAEDRADNGPVGKLRSLGINAAGVEVLEDELGRRFRREEDGGKKKKKGLHSPRRHKTDDNEGSSSEESKCTIA